MSAARADLWPAHLRWPTKAKAKAKNENERKNILAARPAGRLAFIEPPTAPRAALPERPEMNGLVIGVFAEKFACCFCCRRSFSFCFCSAARRRRRRCRGSQQLATSPLTFMAAHQSNDKICCRSSILLVWPSGRRLIGAPVRAKFPLPSPSALHWLALRCDPCVAHRQRVFLRARSATPTRSWARAKQCVRCGFGQICIFARLRASVGRKEKKRSSYLMTMIF